MQSVDMQKFNVLDAVVLDEDKSQINLDSDDSDDFAANFANIVIPDSHQTPIPANKRLLTPELYAFMGDDDGKEKKKEMSSMNLEKKDGSNMHLDKTNMNVK